jgi:hypothetical protein
MKSGQRVIGPSAGAAAGAAGAAAPALVRVRVANWKGGREFILENLGLGINLENLLGILWSSISTFEL